MIEDIESLSVCNQEIYGFLNAFEMHHNIYPNMSEKKDLLWSELETNLANIDEDIIIEDATSIEMYLESGDVGIDDYRIQLKPSIEFYDLQ